MTLTPRNPMRLPLLAAAVLALPLASPAEPLRGIPADVDVAMHISYDEAAKSQLYPVSQELQKRMEKLSEQLDPAGSKRGKELMERLGVKPNSMHTLDIGLRISKGASEEEGPDIAVFGVGRMDLTKEKFDAFAKSEGVAPVAMGGVNGWEAAKMAEAMFRIMGNEELSQALAGQMGEYAIAMPQDGVMIVCPVSQLAKAAGSLAGKTPSFELPAGAQGLVKQTGLAHTHLYGNARKIMETADPEALKTDKSGIVDLAMAVGENEKHFLINGRASFTDEAKAKVAAQQTSAFLAMANLGTAEEETDDEDAKYYKAEAAVFLSGIEVRQEGASIVLRTAYPIDRAKVLFRKMSAKVEELAREGMAQRQAGGAAGASAQDDDMMDAPAKAPEPKKSK